MFDTLFNSGSYAVQMNLSAALVGGVLIGLSAALLLLFNGRIAGISGLTSSLLDAPLASLWRALFLLGLILGAALGHRLELVPSDFQVSSSWTLLLGGGLLVGLGTGLGSGCTSGHGICGLSRLSKRSLVAVLVFMASGFATASLMALWF